MDINEKYGINYSDILKLDNCGLINSSGLITTEHMVKKEKTIILDFNNYVLVVYDQNVNCNDYLSIRKFPLTRAGEELLRIARKAEMPMNYIVDISKTIKKGNKKMNFSLHIVKERNYKGIIIKESDDILKDISEE